MSKKLEAFFKKKFGKTVDQVLAEEDKKEASAKKSKAKDSKGYDELVKLCKDFAENVGKIGQPTDEAPEEDKPKEEKPKKSGDEEVASGLEERLKQLEAAVKKLLEREAKEDEVPVGDEDEEEEVVDEDEEEIEDEAEVIDEDEPMLTGDEKSKVEILAPGMSATKDFKSKSLKEAYKTADGKKVIDALTGEKPDFKSQSQVDVLFNAVPEMLKASRTSQLSRAKQVKDMAVSVFEGDSVMTPEKMNELNAKHYNQKK